MRATFIPFFWLPVLYIYLTQYKGLDIKTTMFLLGLQELFLIFLEIPTGVVADKVSRRLSVALGYILTSAPFLFLPITNALPLLVLIFFVKAVGKALISGADKSLLYDTLLDFDQESKFKTIVNKSNSVMLGVTAVCILLGGFIAEYSKIEYTLILPFPLMLIGAIAALSMDEPETSKKGKALQQANYLKHTWGAFKQIIRKKYLLVGVVLFSLVYGLGVNLKWFYTPIFEYFDIGLTQIGGFTFALYILKSVAAYISSKVEHSNLKLVIGVLNGALAGAFIIGGLLLNKILLMGLLILILFSTEMLSAYVEEYLHKGLTSKDRATSMSIISLFTSIMATVMINGWGLSQEIYGLGGALIFIGILFLIGVGVVFGFGHGSGVEA